MGETVTLQLQVPEEWVPDLQDQTTLLEVLTLGLEEHRIRRALALYQGGVGSIGYVAELVGISERVLIEKARQRGALPQRDTHFADQDLSL
jgi:hypothetical protein